MQTEAPEVFDTRKESPATLAKYGEGGIGTRLPDGAPAGGEGRPLRAGGPRRLGSPCRHHGPQAHARDVDQPIAALVQDLKDRGLLDETLVIVASEFGRTPVINLGGFRSVHNGRDHNIYGFTVLMAGGGAKPGTIYGATDDFGFKVAENPVHVHDLHATALAHARDGSREAHLPLCGPGFPADGRRRPRSQGHPRVTADSGQQPSPAELYSRARSENRTAQSARVAREVSPIGSRPPGRQSLRRSPASGEWLPHSGPR